MGKKYYYVKYSFMKKDSDIVMRGDASLRDSSKGNGKRFFPLMGFLRWVAKQYADIANVKTIQIDNFFEISENDFKEFNELRKSQGF